MQSARLGVEGRAETGRGKRRGHIPAGARSSEEPRYNGEYSKGRYDSGARAGKPRRPGREAAGGRGAAACRASDRSGRVLVTEDDQAWHAAACRAAVPISGRRAVGLYRAAFTHRSSAPKTDPGACNERLEFLGDSVLSAAVTAYLYRRFPQENEGFLSDMRSKLVRGSSLADLANKTGMAAGLMRMDSPQSQGPFDPAHEDLFEAVVGAIFLDRGYESAAAWVTSVLEKHVDVSEIVRGVVSSRAALQKEVRSLGISGLDVEVTGQPGGTFKAVARCDDRVAGVGEGGTAKLAAETACAAARVYLGLVGRTGR